MKIEDPCMPDKPCQARNYVIACFAVSLIQGQSIKGTPIRSRTVKNYIKDTYDLFRERKISFLPIDDTDYVDLIIKTVQKYEDVDNRRNMITDSMMLCLHREARRQHMDSEVSAIIDWLILGRYTGFRQSEWCQTSQSTYKKIENWPGQPPMAMILSDFVFLDKNERRINVNKRTRPSEVHYIRIRWRHQKNQDHGEEITFGRDLERPNFCPVLAALRIVQRAYRLNVPVNEPIGVFQNKKGATKFISDTLVAKLLRTTASKVLNISPKDKYLNLWSTHSIRVTAANLLHREQFSDSFIQKRLRWKSNSFLSYLRNTVYAADQHTLKLADACLPKLEERTYRPQEPHEALTGAAAA